nr:uncharacterized protein LOC127339619 [Lolium perenne]
MSPNLAARSTSVVLLSRSQHWCFLELFSTSPSTDFLAHGKLVNPPMNLFLCDSAASDLHAGNNGAADLIDLPPFNPAPPTRANWSYNPKESHIETNRIIRFMKQLMKDTNICSDDIICAFISRRAKDHFPGIESDRRGPCRKRGLDKFDPDPIIHWQDLKMGRTPASRRGKSPPEPSGSSDDLTLLEVVPLFDLSYSSVIVPLCPPLLGKASFLCLSRFSPSSFSVAFFHPFLFLSFSPALKLDSKPEGSAGSARTLTPPPHSSPTPSGAGNTSASPPGGTTSSGRAAPTSPDHRAEEDLTSPPETQDTGASNTGADDAGAGQAEPLVPPGPKKKKKKQSSSSPSKTAPDTPAPASSTPHPEALILEPTGTTPTQPPSQGPSAATPKPPPAAPKISKFLKPGASRGKAVDGSASSGSQSLVLHVGPAVAAVPEKPSGLLGRIVELRREGKDLGHLLPYAKKWNDADISASTRGLGKDRLPAPDPAGPRSTEEHFMRLKRAVKEFDSAWYDATSNVVVSFANLSCNFC